MIRLNLLVIAAMAVGSLTYAQAQEPVSPDAFVGQYDLVEAREGICENFLDVYVSETSWGTTTLHFGSFNISDINAGPKVIDDELVTLKTNAYTTTNLEVVEDVELVTKPSRTKSVRKTVIRLKGEKLHLKSKTRTVSETDSPLSYGTDCIYRRKPVQD